MNSCPTHLQKKTIPHPLYKHIFKLILDYVLFTGRYVLIKLLATGRRAIRKRHVYYRTFKKGLTVRKLYTYITITSTSET
jgi:hypothetical protein